MPNWIFPIVETAQRELRLNAFGNGIDLSRLVPQTDIIQKDFIGNTKSIGYSRVSDLNGLVLVARKNIGENTIVLPILSATLAISKSYVSETGWYNSLSFVTSWFEMSIPS